IAGMAPGGVVVVWVGGGSSTVEIARFQAEEAEWPPMKKLVPGNPTLSREGYLKIWDKEAAAYLKEHGVPYGLWDTYRTRYPWHPKVVISNSISQEVILRLPFYNGEWFGYAGKEINEIKYPKKAVPKYFIVNWEDSTQTYSTDVFFNETAIFKTYEDFFSKTNKPAYLQISIDSNRVTNVCLMNEDLKSFIKPEKIEPYLNHKDQQ
ncbi:MAG: DUF2931 family protein, partial [Bacteroidales bacterium]